MAGYGYVYELNFDGWLDVSPLVNTKNTQVTFNAFGNDLKGSRDVSKITLMHGKDPRKSLEFHSDVYRRLLEAKNNRAVVRFRMLHGTEAVFTGNVDLGNLKQSTGSIPEEISLEIEDISYLLDKEIPSSVEYPDADLVDAIGNIIDAPIFSKSDPANSIVVKLLLLAGYSVSDIDFNHSNSVMDGDSLARVRFVYDVDDKKTFRDRINTMLMEHRCILTNNADGTFCIRRTFITAEQQAPTIPAYLIKDKITSAGGDYQKDGVAVKWSSLAFAKKQTVYQASVTPSFDSENEDEGEEVEAEGYWPETGDIEDVWYQYDAKFLDRPYYTKQTRLQNKDLSLISSRNVQYEIDCDDTITEVIESRVVLPKKAKFLFYNSAITIKRVRGFNVLADVLFRKKISTYTSPEASTSPEDYESEFVFNAEAADYLASHMFLMHNHGDMTYTWTQKADVNILDVFTVQIPGTAISTKAIVKNVTKTYPTAGLVLCKVTAIGIAPFDLLPSKKVAWINGSGKKGDKGETLIHQWAVGDNGDIPPTFVAVLSENGEPIGYTSPIGFMDQWYTTKPSVPADKYLWHRYRYPSDSEWIYIIETRPVSLNAPYSKIIYKSAAEKPATPPGDCSTIPSGWSTTPPERVEGQTIWASTGNVTWTSINEPVYSEWSTASAWSGDKGEQGLQGLQGPQGDQGIQGPTGEDGLTAYNHIAYADDAVGTGFSQSPTGKAYIGFYTDHTELDSTNPADYAWSLIKGADGTQGIPGPAGADGLTAYFHTAWANSADGTTDFSTTVHAGKLYIGTYSDNTQADSTNPSSYKWVKIKGDTGDTGESAKGVHLYFSSETLPTTSRGVPKIPTITCTALPQNLPVTQASDITWACSDAAVTLTPKTGDMYSVEIDTSEVSTLSFSITATIGAYPVTRWINVVADGKPAPVYAGVQETAPTDIGGEPLIAGDCFLYMPKVGEAYDDTNPLFGHVLKWDGDSWESTTDSQSIGFAAKDAFQIARESGKVIFAAVIYTEAMVAANIQAGSGTGAAGSGFRFRAMDDDYSQGGSPKVPRFDVYDGDMKLFEIDPVSKNINIGDYDSGNGLRWDHVQKKFYIRGHVDADSGNIKGQLDTLTLQTLLGGDTEYPKGNYATVESLLTMLIGEVVANTSLRVTGTINGVGFKSVAYGDISIQQARRYNSGTVLWETWYKTASALVCTVSISFTMDNDSTVTYVLRKIKANTRSSTNTISYEPYPSSPAGYTDLISWADYYAPDPRPGNVPSAVQESQFNDVAPLRNFPYPVLALSVWDSSRERLFIKSLPTSAPSESGRVWRDGTTLKIVP